jgi:zinc/manganese transport system ATP-binding protein
MTNITALEFSGVSLALGGRTVLHDLDFRLAQGQFVGVLGPNGAGKTTLMRAILGLVRPAAGRIAVLGRPATRGQATIGYMPQARGLLGDLRLSGRDFIAAAAGGIGWGLPWLSAAQRNDVDRVIDLVDAGGYAGRSVAAMSGGERQRLMLAQALLGQPSLLLLDEPLSSLDPHRQAATVELVRALQQRLGIAVLFSAHELNPLLPALDQVLYLGGGHAALGSVEEVVTSAVLSRLYGTQVDIVRAQGRIFVMAGGVEVERDMHVHV